MPTTKKRINITAPRIIDDALQKLASRDEMSVSGKAAELLRYAIETEEERIWDTLAHNRDTKTARFLNHNRAWK
ncbi:MAG: hypothetical protein HYY60_00410 [Parcubacteria group bacterium]|nr:hypothetical protein [Parcubacteria group bacterium]